MWGSSTKMHRRGPHTSHPHAHVAHTQHATHKQCPDTYGVRRCKNEESVKRVLLFRRGLTHRKMKNVGFPLFCSAVASRKATRLLARFRGFNSQSTRHGARPGRKLAPIDSVQASPLRTSAFPAAESARNDRRAPEKSVHLSKKYRVRVVKSDDTSYYY